MFTHTTHGASESSIPCRKTPKGGRTPGKRSQTQRIRLQSRPGKPSKQPKRAQPSRVGCRAAPETTKSGQTECEPPYSVARPSLKPAQTECRPTHTVAELGRLRDSGVRLVRRTPSQQVGPPGRPPRSDRALRTRRIRVQNKQTGTLEKLQGSGTRVRGSNPGTRVRARWFVRLQELVVLAPPARVSAPAALSLSGVGRF